MPPLVWANPLAQAARTHVEDIGPAGIIGPVGTDGSLPQKRLARFANVNEIWAESNVLGAITATEVISQLLVCDGAQHRGSRKNFFNK